MIILEVLGTQAADIEQPLISDLLSIEEEKRDQDIEKGQPI